MPSTGETTNIFKYAEFDISGLCRLVSKLRGGQSCICDTFQIPACGSFNWAILISFLDGVEWVLRSLRDDGAINSDSADSIDDENDPAFIDLKYFLPNALSVHIIITTRNSKAKG